ncbi:PEP-CTERM sorting domain-containing protein [Paludisphaera mucosa]|uniref:PEP-CTERM sorting domain-containing protein n=1 Tax=Paludisphaera mucosa TaxID=3030827 RepID=A0ABT6FHJ5_9BACT|nr:PEP-CTERM sorting domain-containing protein [Paludisphaera mucosa]MDG3007058.1 PEP-CTERM sorting domain-containing protein [Paludisphaera mucosa]
MHRTLFALAALGLLASAPAEAGFLGAEMSASYRYPDVSTVYGSAAFTPATFTVTDGPGVETTGLVENVTSLPVQFTDSTLTITLNTTLTNPTWTATDFNGILFALTGPGSLGIVAATVDPSTTLAGFGDSRVTFTDSTIGINWQGLTYHDGEQVVVRFTFAVPEPTSIVTLGVGCVGLIAAGLRRRLNS